MSSTSRRDTIQISLGPSANAVTAHLLNLQGLAATTSSPDLELPICDALTTHSLERNVLVPRVLMIDEPTRFPEQQQPSSEYDSATTASSSIFWDPHRTEPLESSWSRQYHVPPLANFLQTASTLAYSSHSRYYQASQHQQTSARSNISYKIDPSNSRHVNWDDDEEEEEVEQEHPDDLKRRLQRERHQWQTTTQQPLQNQLSTLWNEGLTGTTSIGTIMEEESQQQQHDLNQQQQQQDDDHDTKMSREATLTWMDFWMPPYSPQKSCVALPYSQQSHMVAHWDSYHQTSTTTANNSTEWTDWKQDELSERLRQLLEESDYCQGFTITTEGHGCYAGLATSLLYDIQEECKSAGRLVFHVESSTDPTTTNPTTAAGSTDENRNPSSLTQSATAESSSSSSSSSTTSWQPANVERVRKQVQSGLALADLTHNAHVVLPLQLDLASSSSLFRASAQLAMGLESVTLPFRFRPCLDDSRYKVGLQNAPFFGHGGGSDDAYFRWGTTAQRLSFGEFLTSLQPSSQYKLIELDMATSVNPTASSSTTAAASTIGTLWDHFVAGTSVERDQRMRDEGRDGGRFRARDVPPGGWLQDVQHGGLLSSCSISNTVPLSSSRSSFKTKSMDRSLHHHFALASAVRPSRSIPEGTASNNAPSSGMSQYLTCMVEGMGIQYRPERSMCTVVNQSFAQLTQGGYGAGTYWETILAPPPPSTTMKKGSSSSSSNVTATVPPVVSPPILAVLGNTTRIYPHLHQVATDLKEVLGRSSRYRGLYNRDVMNGVLPEEGDCEEALAACLDVRDVYQPPDASGLVDDDESGFYEDRY